MATPTPRSGHRCPDPLTLAGVEFARRFLLHVLPRDFMRVRYFGLLANRRKTLLARCRQVLGVTPPAPESAATPPAECGSDLCPACGIGQLQLCRMHLSLSANASAAVYPTDRRAANHTRFVMTRCEKSGMPGLGFIAAQDIPRTQQQVFSFDWVAHGCPSPEEFERAVRERPSNGVIQVPEE